MITHMIKVLKMISKMLNLKHAAGSQFTVVAHSCSLFLIINLMLEGQHSDPAAGWIEDETELPGGEMC